MSNSFQTEHIQIQRVRHLMTWNLFARAQISRHESSQGTLETSNPTHLWMAYLAEWVGCINCKKSEIHWKSAKQGVPWHEICALERRFHVMSPFKVWNSVWSRPWSNMWTIESITSSQNSDFLAKSEAGLVFYFTTLDSFVNLVIN